MGNNCSERIDNLENIAYYRAIVSAIAAGGTVATAGGPAAVVMFRQFPDPVQYGLKLDIYAAKFGSGPLNLNDAAMSLGPNSGDDSSSMAAIYTHLLSEDLDKALARVDEHWTGKAADTFTTEYMPALGAHLKSLVEVCEEQKDAADGIAERISAAQNDLVGTAEKMVDDVKGTALAGGAGQGIAGTAGVLVGGAIAAGSVATGGLLVVAVGAIVAGLIIEKLLDYHGEMKRVISSLDNDLGQKWTNNLERIAQQQFDRHIDTYASDVGWQPESDAT